MYDSEVSTQGFIETTMDHNDQPDFPEMDDRPSKSQIKRDMLALQALGKRLVETPAERIKKLNLEEKLLDAVLLAQRTTSREGLRRQVHYVGKLMRDAPFQEIEAQLDTWDKGSAADTAYMHRIERDRDRLLASDEHLTAWLARHPSIDIQAIRSVIRAARQEQSRNEALLPGQEPQRKHYRALFQAIKSAYQDPQNPQDAQDSDQTIDTTD